MRGSFSVFTLIRDIAFIQLALKLIIRLLLPNRALMPQLERENRLLPPECALI